MVSLLALLAVVAAAFLGWNLYHRFASDRIGVFNERRRATSRVVSRGELVDGNRHLPVALAIDQSTFFYENPDMESSLDLSLIQEVEYDTELMTGARIGHGKVLRLRCHSQTFEFVVPDDVVGRWQASLPARGGA